MTLQYEKNPKNLGLLDAVGRASKSPRVAVNLTYRGNPDKADQMVALIGKGLCFDAGGLNLKPSGSIENMYMDKSGACSMFSAFRCVVDLKMKINVTCSLGFVENFVSSTSYRPSDIIESAKGLTVEIGNTDAEGRLVLADLMTWTQQKHKINQMIEFSTLTGACMIALGAHMGGLFTNSDRLGASILKSSAEENEQFWRLPITKEHRETMKS